MISVSIILTTYNSGNQLLEVINSINNQYGVDIDFSIELIVVDDCSTDNTVEILIKNNIQFFSTNKNSGGPNRGRNIALKKCNGDFICIADHDDVWFSNKISELLKVSDVAPIITSGYTLFNLINNQKIKRIKSSSTSYVLYEKNKTFISKLTKMKSGQQTYLGSIMFSSSFKNVFFEEEYGMIDFDWVLRLFHNNSSVEVCKSLYLRKVKRNNLSLDETYRINDYKYSMKTVSDFSDQYPSQVKISKKRINGSMGRYYYLIGDMKNARKYLMKSTVNLISILYLITTFVGHKFVRKHFNIFG
ncbi:glycosyltransferase family 2 protein [Flavobacteriales bacterium]|nr:glycosyltransferase family 2 protein [Flavobacteriales bacterium]